MNKIIIAITLSLLYKNVNGFSVLPQSNTAEKTFPSDLNYQGLQAVLQSIENRMQNLESTLNMQYTKLVEGKIEYYGRKTESIEKDLSQFEAHMRIEMDKILEKISNKNFKDDITKDRTIRKLDGIYERISHKLNNIEGQIDVISIKSQNAKETILSKLDKIEESLTIRDGDIEAEVADAVAAIDDLKTTVINVEENLVNVTKDTLKAISKNNEKSLRKHFIQTLTVVEDISRNISADMIQLQKRVDTTLNESQEAYSKLSIAKTDLDESMNEYANKITDMHSDIWNRTNIMDNAIRNIALILNITRIEQQNGLRALMVQVGRKTSKNEQSDLVDNQKLTELMKKVDTNFENVMLAQNLFLESCHRVQMDESQLESQISIVLDKLIDTFQNKTVVSPKDIKHLEHIIRNHDSNIRKSIYHITSHLLNLIQKNTDNKDEVVDYIKSQLVHLEALQMMVQDALSTTNSEQVTDILQELQVLEQTMNKTQASLQQTNTINLYITKMLNSSESSKTINSSKVDEALEYIKNISHILSSIETKISKSYLNLFLNKYNIELVAHEIGKGLKQYKKWLIEDNNTNITQTHNITGTLNKPANITQIISEIFSTKPFNHSYTAQQNNMEENHESENIVLLCSTDPKDSNCGKIEEIQYTLGEQKNSTNIEVASESKEENDCLPTYINEIDVRSNYQNCSRNTTTNKHTQDNKQNNIGASNCLPHYEELIDVRSSIPIECTPKLNLEQNDTINNNISATQEFKNCSNKYPTKTSNCSYTAPIEVALNSTNQLPNYAMLIDVRSGDSGSITKSNINANGYNNKLNEENSTDQLLETDEVTTDFQIEEQFPITNFKNINLDTTTKKPILLSTRSEELQNPG